jgi:hypothetical protein
MMGQQWTTTSGQQWRRSSLWSLSSNRWGLSDSWASWAAADLYLRRVPCVVQVSCWQRFLSRLARAAGTPADLLA